MTMMSDVLKVLDSAPRIVVGSHVKPDGDSVGSSLGLGRWLRGRGAEVSVVVPGSVPPQFAFLPDCELVRAEFPEDPCQCTVVIVDTPSPGRTGAPDGYLDGAATVVNIDHHPDNEMFGDLNVVDPGASSVALILHEMILESGYEPDRETATDLYVGVLTDTGGFRFGNTDARTLKAAASLVERGADAPRIATKVYGEQSPARLRLLGLVLASLETVLEGRAAVMVLTARMREESGALDDEIEGLASYGHLVRDAEVAALLREENGRVRVSLRSSGRSDVNRVARELGGGGHKAAAGAVLTASLQEARSRVLEAISRVLEGDR